MSVGSQSVRSHIRSHLEFSGRPSRHVRSSTRDQQQTRPPSPQQLALPTRSLAPRASRPLLLPSPLTLTVSPPSRKSSKCPTRSNSTNATQKLYLRQKNFLTSIRWEKPPSSPMATLPSQRAVLSFVRTFVDSTDTTLTPTQSTLSTSTGMGALSHLRRAN